MRARTPSSRPEISGVWWHCAQAAADRSSVKMFSVITSTFWPSDVFTVKRSACASWIATMRFCRISSIRCSSESRRSSSVVDLMKTRAITDPAAEQANRSRRAVRILRFIASGVRLLVPVPVALRLDARLARELEDGRVVGRGRLDELDGAELPQDARALRLAVQVEQRAAQRLAQVRLHLAADAEAVRRNGRRRRQDEQLLVDPRVLLAHPVEHAVLRRADVRLPLEHRGDGGVVAAGEPGLAEEPLRRTDPVLAEPGEREDVARGGRPVDEGHPLAAHRGDVVDPGVPPDEQVAVVRRGPVEIHRSCERDDPELLDRERAREGAEERGVEVLGLEGLEDVPVPREDREPDGDADIPLEVFAEKGEARLLLEEVEL